MEEEKKEVYFFQYCRACKHLDISESEDPCDECLEVGGREETHKPIHYEVNEKKRGKDGCYEKRKERRLDKK